MRASHANLAAAALHTPGLDTWGNAAAAPHNRGVQTVTKSFPAGYRGYALCSSDSARVPVNDLVLCRWIERIPGGNP